MYLSSELIWSFVKEAGIREVGYGLVGTGPEVSDGMAMASLARDWKCPFTLGCGGT